jgi:calcineurin-like phosphoesterase family protein
MAGFFVEFRFHDEPKHYLKGLMHEVAQKFRVKGAIKQRPVPHMALFYGSPGKTDIRKVSAAVEKVGKQYRLVPFKVDKFDWRDGREGKVIAAVMTASPELKKLRLELRKELSKICTPCQFDTQPDFWFHSVIAFKDIDRRFEDIWRYVNKKEKPCFDQHLVRITILGRGRRIIREYDLILKRWLTRREALSKRLWQKTIDKLRELQSLPPEKKQPILERIIGYAKDINIKKSVYLIGDTHFDHANIIRYCHRPFHNVWEMNETIMRNWNETVKDRDTVYFLGDWAYGRRHKPAKYWLSKLKGHIISLKGSHDRGEKDIRFEDFKVLQYRGYTFLLIHDPDNKKTIKNVKERYDWIIHGHKHNNDMRDYPFINGERKTINVSVETINYHPLSLDKLLSLNIDSIRRMQTIESEPETW